VSEAQAQKAVLGVLLVSGAVVIWDNIKQRGKALPTGRSLVAFTILAAGLSIGAGVAPSIVGPFAILIGLAIVASRVGAPGKGPSRPLPGRPN
jgi:hypothetical protein